MSNFVKGKLVLTQSEGATFYRFEPRPLDLRYIKVDKDGKLRFLAPSVTVTREEAEKMFPPKEAV